MVIEIVPVLIDQVTYLFGRHAGSVTVIFVGKHYARYEYEVDCVRTDCAEHVFFALLGLLNMVVVDADDTNDAERCE
ncbi:hypothetical protein NS206_07340 [Microbacterium testaceum]|nr:hypothetical protein NS206_07340 [Microbacterium testaceum]